MVTKVVLNVLTYGWGNNALPKTAFRFGLALGRHCTEQNDTRHNDTQHNDTPHYDTQHYDTAL